MSESREDSKGSLHRTLARPSSASKGSERVAIGDLFVRAAAGGRRGDFFNNLRQVNKNCKLGKIDASGSRGTWQPPAVVAASSTNAAKTRWRPSSPGGHRSEGRAASLPQRSMLANNAAGSPRSPQPLLPCSSRPLMTRHLLPSHGLEAKANGSSSESALNCSPRSPDATQTAAEFFVKHGSPRPILSALANPQPHSNGSGRSQSQPHPISPEKKEMPRKRVSWSEDCKAPPPTSMLALLRGISSDSNPTKPRTPPSPKGLLARAAEASISGSRRPRASTPPRFSSKGDSSPKQPPVKSPWERLNSQPTTPTLAVDSLSPVRKNSLIN